MVLLKPFPPTASYVGIMGAMASAVLWTSTAPLENPNTKDHKDHADPSTSRTGALLHTLRQSRSECTVCLINKRIITKRGVRAVEVLNQWGDNAGSLLTELSLPEDC